MENVFQKVMQNLLHVDVQTNVDLNDAILEKSTCNVLTLVYVVAVARAIEIISMFRVFVLKMFR